MTIFRLFLIILVFLCLSGCELKQPFDTNDTFSVFCDEGFVFTINDEYKVENNVWGFYSGLNNSLFSQCVFFDSLDPGIFGWRWELDSLSIMPSYPRVEFGQNPWANSSTTLLLPKQLKSISQLEVFFDYEFTSSGIYNTSFDIWISENSIPSDNNIRAEIMIWLDANTIPDADMINDNLLINDELYCLYKNSNWYTYPFFLFLKKNNSNKGNLNILPFMMYLVNNKHIDFDLFLADIEFGNEIWSGKGQMKILNYKIDIQ